MQIAFSTNAFKRFDLLTALKHIANVGYQGVEIMCDIPHAYPPLDIQTVKGIKTTLKNTGLKISNLNAFMLYALGDTYHPSFIEASLSERRKRIRHTLNCIDLAVELKASNISVEPGGPLEDGMKPGWAIEAFQEAVEEIGGYAEKNGITVLIEPEPGLLIENSCQFLSFMESVVSPAVGLNFDIGHFYCVGEELTKIIKTLAPFIRHYHIEDIAATRVHSHLIPGKGSIDFNSVLQAIVETGYEGFITVELYPYEEQPIIAAEEALKHLKPLFERQ